MDLLILFLKICTKQSQTFSLFSLITCPLLSLQYNFQLSHHWPLQQLILKNDFLPRQQKYRRLARKNPNSIVCPEDDCSIPLTKNWTKETSSHDWCLAFVCVKHWTNFEFAIRNRRATHCLVIFTWNQLIFASAVNSINSVACDRTKRGWTSLQVSPRFTSAIVTRVRHGCNLLSHIARKARGTGHTPLLTDVTVCFWVFLKRHFVFCEGVSLFILTGESRDIPQVRCRFGEGLQILGHFFEGSGSIPLSLCESCDLEPCHQPLP